MGDTKALKVKELKFHQFLIRYWASGSSSTYVGIARVPFRCGSCDWGEGIETIKIYETVEEAEKVVLDSIQNLLIQFCEDNNLKLEN